MAVANPAGLNHVGPGDVEGWKVRLQARVKRWSRVVRGPGEEGNKGHQPGLAFQSPMARTEAVGSWGRCLVAHWRTGACRTSVGVAGMYTTRTQMDSE